MLTKMPVGGVVWLIRQYVTGFERLGYEVYYVEAHGQYPTLFMEDENDAGTANAASFLADTMKRSEMEHRWAYHALHDDGRCYGLSYPELLRLYGDAALIVNLHGGTVPLEEHASTGRLVYLGTDPVQVELELHRGEQHAIDFLEPHSAFFTWGLNYGNPDCRLPWSDRFAFVPSPPPVVVDLWNTDDGPDVSTAPFTTIGNWRQRWHDVRFEGQVYTWSKHHEFLKIVSLPERVDQELELALGSYDDDDRRLLEEHGWRVRSGLELSADPDSYRDYICRSRGELTAAKDQNVRLRTGWFSERSATYLAAGRPVVQQDTGFGNAIPTGSGVFAFAGLDAAAAAIEAINADYGRHRKAATEIAREFFNYDVVLVDLLDHLGMDSKVPRHSGRTQFPPAHFPDDLDLTPLSRRPLELPAETIRRVGSRPVPRVWTRPVEAPAATVVVVTFNNLTVTRLALESLLVNTTSPTFEVVVVDNASGDGTREYLGALAARNRNVRVIFNETNRGFAAANNQGLAAARGDVCVMLNNDTIVTPGWLPALVSCAGDPSVGLVGPVTNRCGNEAEVPTRYDTYGELLQFARERRSTGSFEVSTSIMFCTAVRRTVFEQLGPLDEQFGIGMFEDDDYSLRARQAGLRVLCAPDAFVHHFGEATMGHLVDTGEHGDLFRRNKAYFEEKWEASWAPAARRPDEAYLATVKKTRQAVEDQLPDTAAVLVVSRGDDEFLAVPTKSMRHFPTRPDGTYAGYHPASGAEAVEHLEELRASGAGAIVFPQPFRWWLDFYVELREHLNAHYVRVVDCEACVIYAL